MKTYPIYTVGTYKLTENKKILTMGSELIIKKDKIIVHQTIFSYYLKEAKEFFIIIGISLFIVIAFMVGGVGIFSPF
jgi:hypothetical protein